MNGDINMPYPPPLYPTHPLMSMPLTATGQNELQRITRHYYPEGDPGMLMRQAAFARRFGLNMSPYAMQLGKVYRLWYNSPTARGVSIILVGTVIAGIVFLAIRKKKD